jgi:hypothetical protein
MAVKQQLESGRAWALSFLISAIVVTFINGPLTLIKELTPLKDALKAGFGHHWVGHGVVLFIIFLVVSAASYGYYRGKASEPPMDKMALLLLVGAFFMLFLILGFFIYEYQA